MARKRRTEPARLFRTGEVLEEAGITRAMLYYYAQIGLLTETELTDAGHRLWGEDVFKNIRMILKLNASGYPLREIREIFFQKHEKKKPRKKK